MDWSKKICNFGLVSDTHFIIFTYDLFFVFWVMNYSFFDCQVCRAEELGYTEPTPVQSEALPVLFSGLDCVIHAQVSTVRCCFDSGKLQTGAYLRGLGLGVLRTK